MRAALQTIVLIFVGTLALSFVVSFGLGLRRVEAPSELPNPSRVVPGVFSGKRVEILNAAGTAGLARGATERLRAAGYDVVFFGNASQLRGTTSIVLDRVGKPAIARAVADRLHIERVETRLDSTRLVEVSVILGADWSVPDSLITTTSGSRN
jgi:hypothetical protein